MPLIASKATRALNSALCVRLLFFMCLVGALEAQRLRVLMAVARGGSTEHLLVVPDASILPVCVNTPLDVMFPVCVKTPLDVMFPVIVLFNPNNDTLPFAMRLPLMFRLPSIITLLDISSRLVFKYAVFILFALLILPFSIVSVPSERVITPFIVRAYIVLFNIDWDIFVRSVYNVKIFYLLILYMSKSKKQLLLELLELENENVGKVGEKEDVGKQEASQSPQSAPQLSDPIVTGKQIGRAHV